MSLNYENFQVQTKPDDFTLSGYLLNTIGNRDFYNRIFQALTKTTKSNFWKNLDHILNIEDCKRPIFDIIYNNIKYYLDNVSNVDLCKVKALQSIISYYGVSYDVFNYLKDMPIELYNMLNLFSINRYYLFDYDRGVLGKDLKEKIYQEVKPDEVSGNTYTDIPIRNMSEIVAQADYAGYLAYNHYNLSVYETSSWVQELTDTYISTAISAGPNGTRTELSVETDLHYFPDTGTYGRLSATVSDLVVCEYAKSISSDPRINPELFNYLLRHPDKNVYDENLIPLDIVVSGYSNPALKKIYERQLRDTKDQELKGVYRSILGNWYTNELSTKFGTYTLLSTFDQSGYDVNLREVFLDYSTGSQLFKLYLNPKSKFALQHHGFEVDDIKYVYLLRNGEDGWSLLDMLSDSMAHGIYDQEVSVDRIDRISSAELIPVGVPYSISSLIPAVSAVTYEIDSLDQLQDGYRDLTEIGDSRWEVTYDYRIPSDITGSPIKVEISEPGLSAVTYKEPRTFRYFFADFHLDRKYTDADDQDTALSTYLISVDFDFLLSSEQHGYDLESEADYMSRKPGSIMLVGQEVISGDIQGIDIQYASREVSYYDYTHIDLAKYRQMIVNAYDGLIRDMAKLEYVDGGYVYETLYDPSDLDQQAVKIKNEFAIPLSFNESLAVDNIEAGISSVSDYDTKFSEIIKFEMNRRTLPSDPNVYASRYAYYRKQKVLSYVNYIESLYNIFYNKDYKAYDVDKTYFNLDDSNYVNLVQKIDGDVKLNEEMFSGVAEVLADMTLNVVSIRDKIKTMVERNSIRGTWLIVALYVIEYFRNVVKNNYKGAGKGLTINDFNLVEYYDNTEYFNIENKDLNYTPEQRQQLNSRFWNETRTGNLEDSQISAFYRDLLTQASVNAGAVSVRLNIRDFLETLYKAGANQYYSLAGNPNYDAYAITQSKLEKLSAGMDPDELSNIADQISAILQESDSAIVSVFNVPVTQRAAVNFDEQLSVY